MKAVCTCILVAALSALTLPVAADTRSWRSQADDSELKFAAYYDGEALPGEFTVFRVVLQTDAETGTPQALTVEVETASADMRDREMNQELLEPGWFDVQAFPSARFESESITAANGGYRAKGRLRLKDVEHPVELMFELTTAGREARIEGSARIARLDWNIGTGEWSSDANLSDRVDLSWRVSLAEAP